MRTAIVLALAFCCAGASPADRGPTRPVRGAVREPGEGTVWGDFLPVVLACAGGAALGLWGGYQRGRRDGSQEGFADACRHLREVTQAVLAGRSIALPLRPPSTGITCRPAAAVLLPPFAVLSLRSGNRPGPGSEGNPLPGPDRP
jgi:hypothetical protein